MYILTKKCVQVQNGIGNIVSLNEKKLTKYATAYI